MTALFEVGRVELTPAAARALADADIEPAALLERHRHGDWGEVDDTRREANAFNVRTGRRVTSVYRLGDGTDLMVSTAGDRSWTRVLLAAEYAEREVGTLDGYAEWAAQYDHERNALIVVEQPLVDALLAGLDIAEALDVGTGTGRHALGLARRGARVTAVDQSPEMLAVAQERARREGLEIDFQRVSVEESLPFADAGFDLVVSALMLCHMPEVAGPIREFARVLRPGGHLLISDFHPDIVAHGWRTQFSRPGETFYLPDMPHTRDDYTGALRDAGLHLLRAQDVRVGEAPEGYIPPIRLREAADVAFCLILLACKPVAGTGATSDPALATP